MKYPELTLRRWRRAEYEHLVGLGVFEGEPIELVDGLLVVAEPQGAYHATALTAVDYAIRAVLSSGWLVRVQLPLSLDDASEPEPDLAVVPGPLIDYRHAHPAHPALVVEVAGTSLDVDRHHKGSLYARAGIQDYWIVNLVDRVVEVYRDPAPDAAAIYGWGFRSVLSLAPPASVAPLAFPSAGIDVATLLP